MSHEKKLQHIKEHPEEHRHDFNGLQACCMTDEALSISLLDAHTGVFNGMHGRHFGGTKCDTLNGPCACGAWHDDKAIIPDQRQEEVAGKNELESRFDKIR